MFEEPTTSTMHLSQQVQVSVGTFKLLRKGNSASTSTSATVQTSGSEKQGNQGIVPSSSTQEPKLATTSAHPTKASHKKQASVSESKEQPNRTGVTSQLANSLASGPFSQHASSGSNSQLTPVQLYAQAVLAERQGRLNDALRAYRAAFRKDENVDKKYHAATQQQVQRQVTRHDSAGTESLAASDVTGISASIDDLSFSFQRTLQLEPDYDRLKSKLARSSTSSYIERLLAQYRQTPYTPPGQEQLPPLEPHETQQLVFVPSNPNKKVHLNRLPDEIIVQILTALTQPTPKARYPDVGSLERGFALVSRKARILSLQASVSLWKPMCINVYRPPLQLPERPNQRQSGDGFKKGPTLDNEGHPAEPDGESKYDSPCTDLAEKLYSLDWRLMWIEQPRIRTDGVYISQITYLRRGAQDGTSYYDPTHVVTYYRYLVFLPDGDVVSLLSHDIPGNVVPGLLNAHPSRAHKAETGETAVSKPATSTAGFTVGRWRLSPSGQPFEPVKPSPENHSNRSYDGPVVYLTSLEDPRVTNPDNLKYSFKMSCRLKSTTRGRWNKLEMISLVACNLRTGEDSEIPIKSNLSAGLGRENPSFYFSRVRSYD